MSTQSEEYQEMQAEYLEMLMSWGRHYIGIVTASINLLEYDISGEIRLSDDKRQDIFRILKDAANKHEELIERSIRELQSYIDKTQGKDHGQ